jgi:hypothetical protein
VIRLPLKPGPNFYEYFFDVGQHSLWAGKIITGIRLDPADGGSEGEFAVQFIRVSCKE